MGGEESSIGSWEASQWSCPPKQTNFLSSASINCQQLLIKEWHFMSSFPPKVVSTDNLSCFNFMSVVIMSCPEIAFVSALSQA